MMATMNHLLEQVDYGVDMFAMVIVPYPHINPNGPTPAWVTNLLLVETPFKTLQGMRRVVATGRYDNAQFDFLEPL
jgi:hypothetical protein